MPYIKKEDRGDYVLIGPKKMKGNPGLLNFVVHQAIEQYLLDNELSYKTLNDILGVLSASSLEVYRRLAVPYEDEKLRINGDIGAYDIP